MSDAEAPVVEQQAEDVPQSEEAPKVTEEAAPPAEEAAPEGDAAEAGNAAAGEAPAGDGAVDPAAAAAAVAARLMAQHGDQGYPVSSGADHAQAYDTEGGNNKRPRDGDAGDFGGPEKRLASGGMLNDAGGHGDPSGNPGTDQGLSEKMDIPATMIGKLIGKAGETIRNLQATTQTRIQIDHTGEGDTKVITISGYTQDQIDAAKSAINALDSADDVTKTLECPVHMVGRIIGRGGETIRALQAASEAHITVNQDFPPEEPRQVVISGKAENCERASLMVHELIHGEPGSAQAIIQRICQQHGIGKTHVVTAPKALIGRIIGRGGETIKTLQKSTGATVQIDQAGEPCRITIAGQNQAADNAKTIIDEILNGAEPMAALAAVTGSYPGGYQMQGGYGGMQGGGYGAPGGGYGAPGGGYGGYPAAGGYAAPGAGYGGYGGAAGGYGGYAAPAADPYAAYGGQYGAAAGGYGGYGAQAGGAGAGGAAPGGSGQWQELHDDQGRPYYYNSSTGVTQWEKPADF